MRHHASHWSCLSLISHIMRLQSQHEATRPAIHSHSKLESLDSNKPASHSQALVQRHAQKRNHLTDDKCGASSASSLSSSALSDDEQDEQDHSKHPGGDSGTSDDEPMVSFSSPKFARLE
jgi:hypothetical protein